MSSAGPTPEQIKAAQGVVHATGLYTTSFFLKDLAERFQHSDGDRTRLLAHARSLNPLLGERVCIEFLVPTGETDATGTPATVKLFVQLEPAGDDYDLVAQQEKVYSCAANDLSEGAKETMEKMVQGQMSFLLYSVRNSWKNFTEANPGFLLELMGADVPDDVKAFVLGGRMHIDPENMTVRILGAPSRRYGIHVFREGEVPEGADDTVEALDGADAKK